MAKTWKDTDISLDPLKDQTIAVIGYGIQGDAQANNMKDSGLNVIVGLKEGGNSWKKAEADGHKVMSVADATTQADIIHILIPDMVQSQVYKDEIGPNLSDGNALSFSHAAAIYWKWIEAPSNVDLIMIAPKGPGSKVRETYLDNFGTPAIVAVEQDPTGKAGDRTLGIANYEATTRRKRIHTRHPCHARARSGHSRARYASSVWVSLTHIATNVPKIGRISDFQDKNVPK